MLTQRSKVRSRTGESEGLRQDNSDHSLTSDHGDEGRGEDADSGMVDLVGDMRTGARKAPPPDEEPSESEENPVLKAVEHAQYGRSEPLMNLIDEDERVTADARDDEGCTLLQWAAINNRHDIVTKLLDRGADVNATGGILSETALQWSVRQGALEAAVVLVNRGADALHIGTEGLNALHLAVIFKHSELILYLCSAQPALVDSRTTDDQTPLHVLLLNWQKSANGLRRGDDRKALDILRSLIAYGASPTSADKSKGDTALHLAVRLRHGGRGVINELLRAGAQIDVKNQAGEDPAQAAERCGNPNAKAAIQKGAREAWFPGSIGFVAPWIELVAGSVLPLAFGWPMGCLSFCVGCWSLQSLVSMTDKMSSNIQHGFASGSIFLIVMSMYFYLLSEVSTIFLVWYCLSVGLLVYNFVMTTTSDPGYLNSRAARPSSGDSLSTLEEGGKARVVQPVEQVLEIANSGQLHALNLFCATCLIEKPTRSKHCPICERCVDRFDHHCPFVNTCVGRKNIGYFMGFCTWCVIAIGSHLVVALPFLWHRCSLPSGRQAADLGLGVGDHIVCILTTTPAPLLVSSILAIFHEIWIFMLWASQMSQIAADQTTYEAIKNLPPPEECHSLAVGLANIQDVIMGKPTGGERGIQMRAIRGPNRSTVV